MPEGDLITTLVTHGVAVLSGSGAGGMLVRRHLAKKDRQRKESEEARKLALELLPAMQLAQRHYTRFLSDSIYLHDIEAEIRNSQISTITVSKPDAALVALIEGSPLHLFDNQFSTKLAGHKTRMQILASELAEKQSSLNYDYVHPEELAVQAKDHLDRSLADLVLDLHHLRREMTVRYLGKVAWPASEKRSASELVELRKRAYSLKSWGDRWRKIEQWLALAYLRYSWRFRRWVRRFRT